VHDTFTILGMDFPAYFTLLMVGYTIVVFVAHRDALRTGIDGNDLLDLAMILIVAGIIGARLLHVVADGQFQDYVNLCTDPLQVKGETLPRGRVCATDDDCVKAEMGRLCHPEAGTCHQGRDCLRPLKFWYGGLTYYGGLALAIPVGIWFIRRRRMVLWKVGDLGGYGIPLGLVFGRLGCFLAGCCYGAVCESHACLAFPAGSPSWHHHVDAGWIPRSATESLPVIPTQLWEAGACLAIFAYLYFWRRTRKMFDGQLFFEYCMLYAVARFVIEFWRDDPRGGLLGLATSQTLGIPLFIFGAFMFIRGYRSVRARPAAGTTEG
jgi:phosphatidylglycerol:prolipoprotein diacylglycerol transferase